MRLTIEGTQDEIIALVRELGEAPEVLLTNADNLNLPASLLDDVKKFAPTRPTFSPDSKITATNDGGGETVATEGQK